MNFISQNEYFKETVDRAVKLTLKSFLDQGIKVACVVSLVALDLFILYKAGSEGETTPNLHKELKVYVHTEDDVVLTYLFEHGKEISVSELANRRIVRIEIAGHLH